MNTNDNAHPFDWERAAAEHTRALASILPTLLSLLPLAVVTAACEWCALYIATMAKGRDEASEMHERAARELSPDVRAVCDVILACVLGHTAIDAIGSEGDGEWEAPFIARALATIQRTQATVTGLAYGERDREGGIGPHDPDAITASDVRSRAYDGQRRAVVRNILATIPQGARDEVLGHVAAWEGVLGGLARAAANTDSPQVRAACDAAGWEAVQSFTRSTRAHGYAVMALSSLWHGVEPLRVLSGLSREAPEDRRELVDECDTAASDLAHVRALLSPVAA